MSRGFDVKHVAHRTSQFKNLTVGAEHDESGACLNRKHYRRMRVDILPAVVLLVGKCEGLGDRVSGGLLTFAGELTDGVFGSPQGEPSENEHCGDGDGDETGDKAQPDRAAYG